MQLCKEIFSAFFARHETIRVHRPSAGSVRVQINDLLAVFVFALIVFPVINKLVSVALVYSRTVMF